MYSIEFYKDTHGIEPVKDFLIDLQNFRPAPSFQEENSKNSQKKKSNMPNDVPENTKKEVINMGSNFNDLWNNPDFITEDEKEKINFEVALIGKLIEARERKGLSQKQLADMCGLKQSAIARLERMSATPQLNTLIKVLSPLGYRLDIVPCE